MEKDLLWNLEVPSATIICSLSTMRMVAWAVA